MLPDTCELDSSIVFDGAVSSLVTIDGKSLADF
jgi:hypothetical protein